MFYPWTIQFLENILSKAYFFYFKTLDATRFKIFTKIEKRRFTSDHHKREPLQFHNSKLAGTSKVSFNTLTQTWTGSIVPIGCFHEEKIVVSGQRKKTGSPCSLIENWYSLAMHGVRSIKQFFQGTVKRLLVKAVERFPGNVILQHVIFNGR